jgi:ABC-2 type transport system permease protein
MMRLIAGELIKVRTTRTALGFGLAALLLVLATVLIGILAGDPSDVGEKRDSLNIAVLALSIPLLLFGIVGATGEYRHRTLAPAVLIAASRVKLTVARLIAYVITALVLGAAMVVVALVIGLPLLSSQPGPDLAGADVRRMVIGSLLVATLCVSLGVGIGVLVRNQVAGVVGALVWLFILAPLLGLIDDNWPDYTTINLAARVGGSDGELSWGVAVLVMVAWAVVFIAVGLLVDSRRDVD